MFDTATHAEAATALLEQVRAERRAADAAEARLLVLACEWADLHPADSIDDAAVLVRGGETALAVAGVGAPLVAEFSVAELAAALRMPTRTGRELIGEALELRHRLPRVWARIQAGSLPAWRGRRIAQTTLALSPEAVAFVDAQVARFAHKVGPVETERLVAEAVVRFMPEVAEAERRRAADRRHVTIDHRSVSFEGTTWITGELDLADALDLDTALTAGAAALAEAGCQESYDVRRSLALGDLARGDTSLDLKREVVLHVHHAPGADITRVEAGGATHLTTVEQVRQWCRAPHARVTVQPVIDLGTRLHTSAYRPTRALAEQVMIRDRSCVFPWCTRTARSSDLDHLIPYDDSGPTSSDNLAALCRHHHRLKTHAGWTYTILEPATYLWSSPHGLAYLRDPSGTQPLDIEGPDG